MLFNFDLDLDNFRFMTSLAWCHINLIAKKCLLFRQSTKFDVSIIKKECVVFYYDFFQQKKLGPRRSVPSSRAQKPHYGSLTRVCVIRPLYKAWAAKSSPQNHHDERVNQWIEKSSHTQVQHVSNYAIVFTAISAWSV